MNYILSKGFKHRKATSDLIANSQLAQSPAILNGKAFWHFPQNKYSLSLERNDNNTLNSKKPKQKGKGRLVNISINYKKPNLKRGSLCLYNRSNSYDKYFLYNIAKNNDKHQSHNSNNRPVPKTIMLQLNSTGNEYNKNSANAYATQQSQKTMSFNSPFLKKHMEMKMKMKKPIKEAKEEENNKKRNNSISMEEYYHKTMIAPFGKMQSITIKPNHINSLKANSEYSQQISKRKHDRLAYNSKFTHRLLITKHIAPLLTLPSQSHYSTQSKSSKAKKINTHIKPPLSARKIEEDLIEETDLNDDKSAKEMFIGDNFNTREIDEDVEKKRSVHTPFQAKSKFEIETEMDLINQTNTTINQYEVIYQHSNTITTTNMSVNNNCNNNNEASNLLSIKYQDIIRSNINYSRHNDNNQAIKNNNKTSNSNSTSFSYKRTVDVDVNKTPQFNKFIQLYPQKTHSMNDNSNISNSNKNTKNNHIISSSSSKNSNSNLFQESDMSHNKPNHIISKETITRVIYSSKKTIQFPTKHRNNKRLSDSTNTENENTVDIDTECLFEGEEKNEREGKKNIPVFPTKLFNYSINSLTKPSNKPKNTPIERLFKKRAIYQLILSLLDYKSLSKLCMCNHYLRNKLKKVQYELLMKTIFDSRDNPSNANPEAETEAQAKGGLRHQIKKSVWLHSKLLNDNFLSRTYYNYAYRRSKYDEDIQKDLTRTFPEDDSFKYRNKNYNRLYHLLTAYANYNKSIGYAQGLNFLAAHSIFLFEKPEEIFLFIDGLVIKFELEQLFGVHNRLKEKMEEIGSLLRKCAPYVLRYLDNISLGHEFFTANWLLTLFSNSMRRKYLFYIWDFMIVFGKQFFNYFIVAIMIRYSIKIVTYDPSLLSQLMKGLLKSEGFESDFELIITKTFELMRIYCI